MVTFSHAGQRKFFIDFSQFRKKQIFYSERLVYEKDSLKIIFFGHDRVLNSIYESNSIYFIARHWIEIKENRNVLEYKFNTTNIGIAKLINE